MAEVTLRVYRSGSAQNLIDFGTDGNYVDLDVNQQSFNIKIDISSIENQGLGEVFSIGSQQFSLPSTYINDTFFNYSFDPGSNDDNLVLTKIFDCQILVNGNSLATGKLYVDSIVKKENGEVLYNVTFNDAIAGIGEFLKDVSLGDFNWSEYDHQYSVTNITSSWEGNLFSGDITYPLYNCGNEEGDTFAFTADTNQTNSPFNLGFFPTSIFKPAVRIKTVMDKIFDALPYSYSSSFLDGGAGFFGASGKTMDDLYMLFTADERRGIVDSVPQIVILEGSTANFNNSQTIDLADISNEVVDTNNQWDNATNTFTAALAGNYNFSFVPIYSSAAVGSQSFKIRSKLVNVVGGATLATSAWSQIVTDPQNNTPMEGVSINSFLTENQAVYIRFEVQTTLGNNYDLKCVAEIENLTPQPDVTILDEQFGDLKAIDFIRGLQQQFNLVFWTDYDNPTTINIEPYNTWADSGERLDWTDRVDHSKGIEIYHPAREQSKEVTFTYKDDSDGPNEYHKTYDGGNIIGQFTLEASSDYAEGEKTIGDKFFAQTYVGPIKGAGTSLSGSNMVIPKIFAEDNRPIKFQPRLLWNVGTGSLDNEYRIIDDVYNIVAVLNHYPQFNTATAFEGNDKFTLDWNPQGYWRQYNGINGYGHWTNNTVYNKFWARWMNNVYRSPARKMVCNIKFTPSDIFEFNVNDLIHIDGHDYRINKISGFNLLQDESVTVEFLKELAPVNSAVYLIGNNTIVNGEGGYDGPVMPGPITGDEITWEDDPTDTTGTTVEPVAVPDNVGPTTPGDTVPSDTISNVVIYKGGYRPIDNGAGGKTIKKNVPVGRQSETNVVSAAQQNDTSNKPIAGDNNVVSPSSAFTQIIGDGNSIGGEAKRIMIVGDDNSITPSANQVLVVGDNFDTSGGGTIDTTVLIGNQGGTLDDDTEITNAFVVGLASNIETTFNDGVLLGRNSIIRGTLGFQDCAFSTYGIVDADDYVGTSTQMLASTFLGNPVKTSFDNDLDATYYNTSVILGKRFDFGAVNKGFVEETAMGAAQNYNVNSTDVVVFLDGGGGTGTCQLPDATANEGRVVTIKSRVTAGIGACAISDAGGNLVEGGATYTLNATENYDFATFMSDGNDWWLIGRK